MSEDERANKGADERAAEGAAVSRPPCVPDAETELDWETIALRGRALRFVLVAELMDRPEATVADLVAAVAAAGFHLQGRPSKVISDALRWEVRRGRVQRLGRGIYRYRSAPRTTARRIRLFAEMCRARVVAVTRTQRSKHHPGESDPRWPDLRPGESPGHSMGESRDKSLDVPPPLHGGAGPPWDNVGWLWST